ncbi:2-amino-4-hydroxy-6-hydroxymethyldihydropteridine diphosphokinase [Litorimonas sp. RW-G-Af-16]|uniref:2-amino-4-hydroxy-6- hydroxymethyldihydropteridine diphosphokinase n=1 Tax=Litorimonas sp. RW-G-Af-16 TaxID=3241168 RepID=UPI00390C94B4
MKPTFIAFGANLSNPKDNFLRARDMLRAEGMTFQAFSGLWQSPAWPAGSGAPDYINAVALVEYDGEPTELMSLLLRIETQLGRVRSERNAPRTLDLDLLVWGDLILKSDHLTLPHPRMLDRPFVLLPILDIAPDWQDAEHKLTPIEHLAKIPMADVLALHRVTSPLAL